jgi:PhnB protein
LFSRSKKLQSSFHPLFHDPPVGVFEVDDISLGMEPAMTPKLAPYLLARDATGLARFIEKGIGGQPGFKELDKQGKIAHLEMQIAYGVVMLADAPEGREGFPAMLHLYVADADAAYGQALEAGATSIRAPRDAEDGRRGGVRDAWGNEWWFTRPAM